MKKLFKAKVPDLSKYIGRKVSIDGKKIKIETIVGNKAKPAFYEINGEHLIGMLRFHAQMLGDKSITEDQFIAFEKMDHHVEKREKEKVQ
jgi:hypothetical protein